MNRSANIAIFVPHAGCPHQCAFCDQRHISGAQGIPSNEEIAAILADAGQTMDSRRTTAQIAFFGGSFTAIPRAEMLRVLEAAAPYRDRFDGIRVSTRPDAIDDEILDLLSAHGVSAIELGAQSMDDLVLAECGRGHTAANVSEAAKRIKARGFSLGLQMMTGLPLDTDDTAMVTAQALAALRPDTVRIYPTLVLEHTPLAGRLREGTYEPQTLEQAVELCARLLEYFTDQGIPVIRMGLHDSPTLRQSYVAGPYHPAFRELCEGEVLYRKALEQLQGQAAGAVVLRVAAGATSKMAGQRRRNLERLEKMGYAAKIIQDETMPYLHVEIQSH